MPTNRRYRTAPRRGTSNGSFYDSPRTCERLLSGHDFRILRGEHLDDAELREAWEQLRDDLLAEFIRERPGTRPWAWWHYDGPEPRRQVGDGPEALPGCGLWFGMPSRFVGIPAPDQYESEFDFLRRHDPLVPADFSNPDEVNRERD